VICWYASILLDPCLLLNSLDLNSSWFICLQQNRWDLENIEDPRQKIWVIARTRYAGWHSALSATYKAYETNEARIKNKPVDVDSVEWHYLMKYFATEKFKVP
jgi:hypothetical protein